MSVMGGDILGMEGRANFQWKNIFHGINFIFRGKGATNRNSITPKIKMLHALTDVHTCSAGDPNIAAEW